MAHAITPQDLHPLDILVLRDLVRFGVMADDQIARRYRDNSFAADRLALLEAGSLINKPRPNVIQGAVIYTASPYGNAFARCGLGWRLPLEGHLAHDIAVVDLADCLLAQDPQADWKSEREIGRVLREVGPPMRGRGLPREIRHTPDGLLVSGGRRLAIELEHSDKGNQRYVRICRWFARELRLDGVRWYVDNPKISDRIRRANRQHGFDRDTDVKIEDFPPGVVVRNQARRWTR